MGSLLEVFNRIEGADDAVLVKAKAPVSAAKISTLLAVDFVLALLGGDAGRREKRMMVDEPLDDFGGRYALAVIQRHAEGLARCEPLQDVHVVGQGDALAAFAHDVIIPRRPCPPCM